MLADDMTVVTRNRDSKTVTELIFSTAAKHGVKLSKDKLEVYSSGRGDAEVEEAIRKEFEDMGIEIRTEGIGGLLGAPIGTTSFVVTAEGHLQALTKQTERFLGPIDEFEHPCAKHLMLWLDSFTVKLSGSAMRPSRSVSAKT